MSYTAEETRNKLVGITELVKELVLFPGHTRLLPVYVWLIQVFLGLLLVRIGSQTFAYIVFSCEKGMTVMDQMLTAVLFLGLPSNGTYVKPVYLIAFFFCAH